MVQSHNVQIWIDQLFMVITGPYDEIFKIWQLYQKAQSLFYPGAWLPNWSDYCPWAQSSSFRPHLKSLKTLKFLTGIYNGEFLRCDHIAGIFCIVINWQWTLYVLVAWLSSYQMHIFIKLCDHIHRSSSRSTGGHLKMIVITSRSTKTTVFGISTSNLARRLSDDHWSSDIFQN